MFEERGNRWVGELGRSLPLVRLSPRTGLPPLVGPPRSGAR